MQQLVQFTATKNKSKPNLFEIEYKQNVVKKNVQQYQWS